MEKSESLRVTAALFPSRTDFQVPLMARLVRAMLVSGPSLR
ncbi:hypothetical protein ATPR_1078 [Acetobacter tropicalis NBRC 101654]|uniref:Uncharacterized protein n=1 Tax=Acetobacter tropicalis NBRC 101654 TaxID=749388 RepID=F7VCH9_9PROT|nr:hypothetical protein ATPR_1078 [Acetobacter tropicalis NBRC 101654]